MGPLRGERSEPLIALIESDKFAIEQKQAAGGPAAIVAFGEQAVYTSPLRVRGMKSRLCDQVPTAVGDKIVLSGSTFGGNKIPGSAPTLKSDLRPGQKKRVDKA